MSVSKTALADHQVQGVVPGHRRWPLGMRASQDCWSQQGETQSCAKPSLCCAVGLVSLLSKECCQPFVENSSCLAHSTTCCKYQWSEGGPLDFSDSLFIGAALFLCYCSCQLVRLVGWGPWVEDPYIKKCQFELASPETSCTDVRFGFLSMNAGSHEQHFSGLWEVAGVASPWPCYIHTSFSDDIVQFIMADGWVSYSGAG